MGVLLAAILTAASNQHTVAKGGVLLAFYSAGLAVPFLLSALAFTQVTGFFRFFRDHYRVITFVSGAILIAMGVLLYQNELTRLNSWLNDAGLNAIGQLMFAPAYPWWSLAMFAIDILIIYGLAVYGGGRLRAG